jgi:hypothetical protein
MTGAWLHASLKMETAHTVKLACLVLSSVVVDGLDRNIAELWIPSCVVGV